MPATQPTIVEIGGNKVVFSPAYGSPFVMDLDKGRRYGTLEDFRNFVKLAQSSPLAAPFRRHDLRAGRHPGEQAPSRHGLQPYPLFRPRLHGLGHLGGARGGFHRHGAHRLFGDDFVDRNCVILGNVNVNSPLVWDGTMTKALRAYARANQAAVIVPFILGGAMGPVTNAGAIAQSWPRPRPAAPSTQLERKGAPVIFGNFLSSMSLRSGSPTFGTPEPAIGSMVIGQLARRLNLPLRCCRQFHHLQAAGRPRHARRH
jgi:trimethylamine--corrinoid protein Co-methyltransferase